MAQIIKNFLNEKEILDLYTVFGISSGQGNKYEETARYVISGNNHPIIIPIIEKIEKTTTELYGKPLKAITTGFHVYSQHYGPKPKLEPHIDEYVGEVVFDYQIRSSHPWPVRVDKVDYTLSDNDALMFMGETQAHSRRKVRFDGDMYTMMYIVNLISEDHWYNYSKTNPKSKEELHEAIRAVREDQGNW